MAERRPYKRRNYMINPRFQLRFMAYVVFAVLLSLTVLYLSNSYYFDGLVAQGEEIGLDPSHPYYELIKEQRTQLMETYLAVSAVVFALLVSSALLLSHRIAGPLYHITRVMNLIIARDAEGARVHLRKGDFFSELEGVVNELITHLEGEADRNTQLALDHLRDASTMQSLFGARILLVEDNKINQQLTSELLHSNGVTVVSVDNGLRALDLLAVDPDFDGILMDDLMPEMGGYEAARQIRAQPGFETLPIVSISVNDKSIGLARAQEAGMNDHVGKPIAVRELFTVLAKWITPAHPVDDIAEPAEVNAVVNAIPPINGVNTANGLIQNHHNQMLYIRLLTRFLETQVNFKVTFLASLREKGPADAAREAHILMRLGENIGAPDLQREARALEQACQQDASLDDLTDVLAELTTTLDSVLRSIEAATAHLGNGHSSLSPAEYAEALLSLQELIKTRNADAGDTLRGLILRAHAELAKQLADVMTALDANDFELAQSMVEQLSRDQTT